MAELTLAKYFSLEWFILGKGMTQEQYNALSTQELDSLKAEYAQFQRMLNILAEQPGGGLKTGKTKCKQE